MSGRNDSTDTKNENNTPSSYHVFTDVLLFRHSYFFFMKLIEESSSRITLEQDGWKNVIFGLIFTVFTFPFYYSILSFSPSGNLFPLAFISIFAVIGVYTVLAAKFQTITLDKGLGKAITRSRSALGTKGEEVLLADIAKIQHQVVLTEMSKGGTRRSYLVSLVLKDGRLISFQPIQSSMSSSFLATALPGAAEAKRAADFLGIPFEQQAPPSFGELLSTVKTAFNKADEQKKNEF